MLYLPYKQVGMLTKVSKVCAQYLNSADKSSHEFARIFNIAIRGLENEMNLDVGGNFKTVLLDVQPNQTVQLPPDYVNYSKIGIVNQMGEFVTLKRNNQMSNYHAIYYQETNRNAGVPSINSFANAFGWGAYPYNNGYWYNFWNNGTGFNLYGLDSGTATIGTYKIDLGANVIILNQQFPFPQILLEYLSDGFDDSEEDYMIDSRCAEALLAWIRWQAAIDMPKKYSPNSVAMYSRMYYNEKRKAKMRVNGFNLAEFNDIIRRKTNLTAKA